jgi:hypothetical protein
MLMILLWRVGEVVILFIKLITDKLKMLACIRKVIKVVVRNSIINMLVIIVTDYYDLVLYLWRVANAWAIFFIT